MRNTKKVMGIGLLAGLLIAGGSAFTASNTMPAASTAGYGSVTVSGATVNSIHYTLDSTGTKVASVIFNLASNLSALGTGTMNLTEGTGLTAVTTTYSCTTPAVLNATSGGYDLTCSTGANQPAVSGLSQTALTVVD